MEPFILVRLSETTLKGRNRVHFETRMARNVALHLKAHGQFQLERHSARLMVRNAGPNGADNSVHTALAVLKGLPGIANLSLVRTAPRDPDELAGHAQQYLEQMLQGRTGADGTVQRTPGAAPRADSTAPLTFRVEAQRKDKRYPLHSMELAARLGKAVLDRFPALKVDLEHPDLVLNVEIWPEGALLYAERVAGPGGLPVGSSGKAVCLQSAGIDSPVAAYLMMTRGVAVVHLNFHSFPFIGEQSKDKVRQIARFLARYQPASRLIVAPFAEIQLAIRDHCPERLRTLLYRRFMNRVANHVARQEKALALITGESAGQVASQTLRNLHVIHAVAELPVLQPLIGLSKTEIVQRARAIGTYPISIQPYPDCCTLFQPRHPETGARLKIVEQAEAVLPVEQLVQACLAGLEVSDYGPEYFPATWDA